MMNEAPLQRSFAARAAIALSIAAWAALRPRDHRAARASRAAAGDGGSGELPADVAMLAEPTADARRSVRQAALAVAAQTWMPFVIGVFWFVLMLAAISWSWRGSDSRYFEAPDEAVNRLAAELVARTGSPKLDLAQADPEDLRHPRLWVTMGDEAIPSYPPASYYLQAAFLKTPLPSGIAAAMLSAVGVAALAAGVALLGARRRWVGFFAPAMAFPALYWMTRPWMNMATLLSLLCVALFFFACWRRTHRWYFLAPAALFVAGAAAVRPDYAAFVLAIALLAGLAEARPGEGRAIFAAVALAGIAAVAVNLALNTMTTGDPLTAAYEISDARRADSIRDGLPGPVSKLMFVLLPYGLPQFDTVMDQMTRYWLRMGPVALLTLGLAALFPLLSGQNRASRCYWALVAVAAIFTLTHLTTGIFGADADTAELRHSVARYWSPVYLLAALAPALLAMSSGNRRTWAAAAALSVLVAFFGALEIYNRQPESLDGRRAFHQQTSLNVERWQREVPADSLVYTLTLDKLTWSEWEVASIPKSKDQQPTAASIERAIAGGQRVYLIQHTWPEGVVEALRSALASRGLELTPVGDTGAYSVTPQRAAAGSVSSARSP